MAKGLSFMFQASGLGAKSLADGVSSGARSRAAAAAGGAKSKAAGGAPAKAPDILHYIWLVEVPEAPAPANYTTFLLTTVYDESFEAYIRDLVMYDHDSGGTLFDTAAKEINGLGEKVIPVYQHISEFTEFIAKHDLTQSSPVGAFTAFYPWTVALIHKKLGPPPPKSPARPGPRGPAKSAAR